MKKLFFAIALCGGWLSGIQISAQTPGADTLYARVLALDQSLDAAFDTHNLDAFRAMFDKDLEFYHDKGGLIRYDQCIEAFGNLFAQSPDIRRELIPGSMEVYPVPGYGAMQIAAHRFCHTENGEEICGTFKFVHIWKNTGGVWTLARVVSYDH